MTKNGDPRTDGSSSRHRHVRAGRQGRHHVPLEEHARVEEELVAYGVGAEHQVGVLLAAVVAPLGPEEHRLVGCTGRWYRQVVDCHVAGPRQPLGEPVVQYQPGGV
jgi:hypothetical protein